jgi:phosphoribosylamine--glycine ligase
MLRFRGDLVDLCLKALDGKLNETSLEWDPRPALGVVMAAGGYPDAYEANHPIHGLGAPLAEGVKVFHAGTRQQDEETLTAGGRVLCVTALGTSIEAAQTSAYTAVHQIHWDGVYYRNDIGHRAITRKA